MNMSTPSSPLVIGMILFPDLTQLDLSGPYEVSMDSALRQTQLGPAVHR